MSARFALESANVSEGPNASRRFSTAEETAYPMLLAYTMAYAFAQHLMHHGWQLPPAQLTPPDNVSYQYLRALVGSQPKASKLPPLLSEFASIVCVPVCLSSPQVQIGQLLPQPFANVPAGARLLKRPPLRLNGDGNNSNDNLGNLDCGDNLKDNNTHWAYFGVYRSCDACVEAAVKAGHPVSKANRLPEVLQEAVDAISSQSAFQLAKERHATLSHWLNRARALSSAELGLHSEFPEALGKILAPKRLLLWKEMLIHYGYPDVAVFDEVVAGIHLAGAAPAVPCCFRSTLCRCSCILAHT